MQKNWHTADTASFGLRSRLDLALLHRIKPEHLQRLPRLREAILREVEQLESARLA